MNVYAHANREGKRKDVYKRQDCILTAKLDYAEKHGIKTEYSIMAPENFPLDSVAVSYTHLDVYKRQPKSGKTSISLCNAL